MKKKILLVEDSIEISDLVELHLVNSGFQIDKAFDGAIGLSKAIGNQYHLIILDLSLPQKNGIEICQTLRKTGDLTPILMLSAWSENSDKIRGYKVGANAYLTKPFRLKALTESVNSLIKNKPNTSILYCNDNDSINKKLTFQDFTIDLEEKVLMKNNQIIPMTYKEYCLLHLLALNPGKVYSRSEILTLIWGFDLRAYRYKVTSYISKIRRKVEPDFLNPIYILPSNEGGFKFNEQMPPAKH